MENNDSIKSFPSRDIVNAFDWITRARRVTTPVPFVCFECVPTRPHVHADCLTAIKLLQISHQTPASLPPRRYITQHTVAGSMFGRKKVPLSARRMFKFGAIWCVRHTWDHQWHGKGLANYVLRYFKLPSVFRLPVCLFLSWKRTFLLQWTLTVWQQLSLFTYSWWVRAIFFFCFPLHIRLDEVMVWK